MPELMELQAVSGPHHDQSVVVQGLPLEDARAAMILVHGRGATAESILVLADEMATSGYSYLAPQAANNSWYPHSFLAPLESNEPGISSGLAVIGALVAKVEEACIPAERVVLAGFSQGACLAAEYAARHARRYGGLLVFSGGLIGPPGTPRAYAGSLSGTPVFIGCSDVDFHIPLERVHETTKTLQQLGGDVDERVYSGMGHTIMQDEIDVAMSIVRRISS